MVDMLVHEPVLLENVCDVLSPQPGETIVDATSGLGGHSRAFAERIGPEGNLICIDADEANLQVAKQKLSSVSCSLTFVVGNFRDLSQYVDKAHVIFADLGLSSPHLDDPMRGFSFRSDAPLDMRFNRNEGMTAAEFIAQSTPETLKTVLRDYGELRQSARLAAHLVARKPTTTLELRSCIEEIMGFRAPSLLPQIFQALRIAINDELGALQALLGSGPSLLLKGGRMGVISYHSLEDRMVKVRWKELTTPSLDQTTGQIAVPASFTLLTKKALQPLESEIASNPRARSAKFRACLRIV